MYSFFGEGNKQKRVQRTRPVFFSPFPPTLPRFCRSVPASLCGKEQHGLQLRRPELPALPRRYRWGPSAAPPRPSRRPTARPLPQRCRGAPWWPAGIGGAPLSGAVRRGGRALIGGAEPALGLEGSDGGAAQHGECRGGGGARRGRDLPAWERAAGRRTRLARPARCRRCSRVVAAALRCRGARVFLFRLPVPRVSGTARRRAVLRAGPAAPRLAAGTRQGGERGPAPSCRGSVAGGRVRGGAPIPPLPRPCRGRQPPVRLLPWPPLFRPPPCSASINKNSFSVAYPALAAVSHQRFAERLPAWRCCPPGGLRLLRALWLRGVQRCWVRERCGWQARLLEAAQPFVALFFPLISW